MPLHIRIGIILFAIFLSYVYNYIMLKGFTKQNVQLLKYVVAMLIFGTNGIVANYISVSSIELVFFRTLLGGVILAILFSITVKKFCAFKTFKSGFFVVLSGVFMGVSWICLFEAYNQVGVSVSTLIYYLGPVFVMISSPFIFKEKLTLFKVLGFVVVVVGLLFINIDAFNSGIVPIGVLIALLSAFCYFGMIVCNKISKAPNGIENTMIQLLTAFIIISICLLFKRDFTFEISKGDILPIIILGIINTGLACYMYFSSIGQITVTSVAVLGYIDPVTAIILSFVVLGEKLVFIEWLGAFLIIAGAIIGECFDLFFKKKVS